MRVRPLEARDKSVWLTLFKGYIEFYKATVADDVIETTWQRLMQGGEGFHIALVAVDDADTPVGLAHVLFHRSTWSPTWYCYLEDLFVDPAQRAKGAGRALIEAVYKAEPTRTAAPAPTGRRRSSTTAPAPSTTRWRPSRRSCSIDGRSRFVSWIPACAGGATPHVTASGAGSARKHGTRHV